MIKNYFFNKSKPAKNEFLPECIILKCILDFLRPTPKNIKKVLKYTIKLKFIEKVVNRIFYLATLKIIQILNFFK